MPAADVCRALAVAGATGVLEIEGPDGRGSVVCRDGHVIAATSPSPRARLGDRLINAGLLEDEALDEVLRSQARASTHRRLGALLVDEQLVTQDAVRLVAQEQVIDAVFDVLRWRYGGYRFDEGELEDVPEVPLRIPVAQLLVEVARRQQEWAELERVIPDLEAVPTFTSRSGSAVASLEPDEFTVLASIDGVRSVRELADDLGYGQFEAARIVYGLTLLGVVEVALPEDEVGRALEDALQALSEAGAVQEPEPEPDAARPPPAEPAAAEPEPDAARPPSAKPAAAEPDAGIDPEAEPGPVPEPETRPGPETRPEPEPAPSFEPSLEFSDVARLLAEMEADRTPGAERPAPTPADAPSAAVDDAPTRSEPGPDATRQREPGATPDPAPEREPVDGREVSELLRELSRLSLDDPEPPAGNEPRRDPPPQPRPPEPSKDEPSRKRRLFGRG